MKSHRSDAAGVTVRYATYHDVSEPLVQGTRAQIGVAIASEQLAETTGTPSEHSSVPGRAIEQISYGSEPPADVVASFDGLGLGFDGPQGTAELRNPSDNSLAVGPNHIVQIVNSMTAIFSKKGDLFNATGRALYGPVETRNVFRGFGGPCESTNNGDAVVRYDQLADRWLIVMPIFQRAPLRTNEPSVRRPGQPFYPSMIGQAGQPGRAELLSRPRRPTPEEVQASDEERRRARAAARANEGSFAMCYAVSTGPSPFGPFYRYEFVRPLFPDYPRPAVWPDGYYIPTSTGDDVIEKHLCIVDRARMLLGEPATEQCLIFDDVNFLNNADLDGRQVPPAGSPNIMMATGGAQLRGVTDDDGIYAWKIHVNWDVPSRTRLEGPDKIIVEPYEYLCGGQLTECVPQPGTDQRLDSQGDKIMSRLVYRRIGTQESIIAVHSINTTAGGGGVRWYEFRLDAERNVRLFQQGTYAPEGSYRWMASPAIDGLGNIGIGYSFGDAEHYAGQRFAGRTPGDPPGLLTLREAVLVEGQAAQTTTRRWEDYTQTAVDPTDDCTIWYVGDYLKAGASAYSTRIGAFRMPGCSP